MKKLILFLTFGLVFSLMMVGVFVKAANASASFDLVSNLIGQAFAQGTLQVEDEAQNGNVSLNENGDENDVNGDENGDPNGNGDDQTNGDEVTDETFKQPKDGCYCDGTAEENHPAGDKLAEEFGVEYEEIIGWFCKGYGFGEIKLAYHASKLLEEDGITVEEIFAQRGSGMGWGNILKSHGLIGKGSKTNPENGINPDGDNGNGENGNPGKGNAGKNGKEKNNNGNHNGNGKGNKKP